LRFAHGGKNQFGIAGQVADDRVDLGKSDFHGLLGTKGKSGF